MHAGPEPSAEEDLDRLVRRLRGLSGRAWSTSGRREAVSALLRELAQRTAAGRAVPELPDHALAEAVAVLGRDGLTDPATREETARLIGAGLERTR